jgi:hypothetical protein
MLVGNAAGSDRITVERIELRNPQAAAHACSSTWPVAAV